MEIFTFIETFHNRRGLRKHPAWGCLTPLEIRQRHEQQHIFAAQTRLSGITGNLRFPLVNQCCVHICSARTHGAGATSQAIPGQVEAVVKDKVQPIA